MDHIPNRKNTAEDREAASTPVRPFLKWAGGKRQLIPQLQRNFPEQLIKGEIEYFYEPFLGSGALFFWISQKPHIKRAFLNEFNPDIYLCYVAIQKDPEIVIGHLHKYAQEYKSLDPESRKRFYYEVREAYNQEKPGGVYDSKKSPARVAMTIFLNRTCYNGLYRVNSKGNFNVPFGRYTNPKVCDATNLRKVSEALQKAEITNGDFEVIDGRVNKNSFVYFDPPYKPVSQTSSFTAYSKKCFDDTEQKRLASLYGKMASKANVFLMLSNSTPKPNIFKELYKGFQVKTISANRHINCISAKRGKVKEILVMNYPTSGFRVRPTKRPKDIHP